VVRVGRRGNGRGREGEGDRRTERNWDFDTTLSLLVVPLDFSSVVMPLVDMIVLCLLIASVRVINIAWSIRLSVTQTLLDESDKTKE
jgi:hypothetical protein